MKVLIAMDTSACSKVALDLLLSDRSWPEGTKFRLISCLEPIVRKYPSSMYYPAEMFDAQEALRAMLEEMMSNSLNELRKHFPDCEVEGTVVEGLAVDTILLEAKGWNPDLIVLGSHGRKGFEHFVLGSVAEKVIKEADCAVTVLRSPLHQNASGIAVAS
ncbi:MAG TPA: universal stress protein [Oculatellaceae cyanobacterium]